MFPAHNGEEKDLVQCLEIHLADDRCWLVAEISRFTKSGRGVRNSSRFVELIAEMNRTIQASNA